MLLSQFYMRDNFIGFDRASTGLDIAGKSELAKDLQDDDKQAEELEAAQECRVDGAIGDETSGNDDIATDTGKTSPVSSKSLSSASLLQYIY